MRSSPPETRGKQTLAELRKLQRLAGEAIFRPLGEDFRMDQRWKDGRATAEVVETFIKPNDRLSSFERVEIYNKQYWFRLIDNLFDDFPGLVAILGDEKFNRLARAYGAKYPSRSFTLRNLGSQLPRFLQEEPQWVKPQVRLCQDMAKFEWAQVVAFDGLARPAITADDLLGKDPAKIRLGLQPYLTLLDLGYPLDDYAIALKKSAMRGEASNAVDESEGHGGKKKRVAPPRARRTWVAVFRLDYDLYFKRLGPAGFRLVTGIGEGKSLTESLEAAKLSMGEGKKVKEWFEAWTSLGWFCKRK